MNGVDFLVFEELELRLFKKDSPFRKGETFKYLLFKKNRLLQRIWLKKVKNKMAK